MGINEGGAVTTRLMYGTYAFNDVTVLFGQDYAPLADWGNSNQVFGVDNDMADFGEMDEARVPQIKIKYKGFQAAFVDPRDTIDNIAGSTAPDAHTQTVLPHLELKYSVASDKFFGDIFGGANTYKVNGTGLDKNVNSYALGLNGGITMSPIYANAMVWMAQNGNQLGLLQADAAGAFIDANGKTHNDNDFGYAVVVGGSVQKVNIEAGYGYVQSKNSAVGTGHINNAQNYYLQAVIPVAEKNGARFSITPEIGMFDFMKDASGNSQGSAKYIGAKWQVDF
jgi:hypothetical protein